MPKYLTKSLFKLGVECPSKLFYFNNPTYANQKTDDPFLEALARGGFQVGELAKCYFPDGVDIGALDYEEALEQTYELLRADDVTIFEAAVKFENFFIRVDVLVKRGGQLDLIEVKAKSYSDDEKIIGRDGLSAKWRPYLYDIAFQKFVVANAFPDRTVSAFLMLTDKDSKCPTNGLNQKFRVLTNDEGRKYVEIRNELTAEELDPANRILRKVAVDDICELIFNDRDKKVPSGRPFAERAREFADFLLREDRLVAPISSECKICEFRATPEEVAAGKLDGHRECWSAALGWTDADFASPTILDLWDHRTKDKFLLAGKVKFTDLSVEDIGPEEEHEKPGLSRKQRQWLQVEKAIRNDATPFINVEKLKEEMDGWEYPLHFIDFETATPAIPFVKGRRPYEVIAFQFSHHTVAKDGTIQHVGQHLDDRIGAFPNYDFVRKLREQLSELPGTIFRFADHENSILNMINRQIAADESDIPDREELTAFIKLITKSPKDSVEKWRGERNMVDMRELVLRYYYDPLTRGSNSIKQVLPAILSSSEYLKGKYSRPIYGTEIPSLNFPDGKVWVEFEGENVVDPYLLLPKMFGSEFIERLSDEDELKDGGAAMMAYARLQFEDMTVAERDAVRSALLRYCELDTLAMVMIYEGWREMIG